MTQTLTTATLNLSAAAASISVAVLLVALKAWAAWSTGSTAMLGSLADTMLDLVASLDKRTLVQAGTLVQTNKLAKHVLV